MPTLDAPITCQIFDLDIVTFAASPGPIDAEEVFALGIVIIESSTGLGSAVFNQFLGEFSKRVKGSDLKRVVYFSEVRMQFVKESLIHCAPERVFAFHELPDAFERLIPPWEKIKVIQKADISKIGSRTIVETRILGPIRKRLIAEHTAYDPPRMFEDTQIAGPFRRWRHRHIVKPHEEGAILRDEVEFEPPLPIFGPLALPLAIMPRLEKMFAYRHEVTKRWCEKGI